MSLNFCPTSDLPTDHYAYLFDLRDPSELTCRGKIVVVAQSFGVMATYV